MNTTLLMVATISATFGCVGGIVIKHLQDSAYLKKAMLDAFKANKRASNLDERLDYMCFEYEKLVDEMCALETKLNQIEFQQMPNKIKADTKIKYPSQEANV